MSQKTFVIRDGQNQTTQLTLDDGLTVQQVRERLAKERDIPSDQVRLVFAGNVLQDGKQFTDYKVGPGSEVKMVLVVHGGWQIVQETV